MKKLLFILLPLSCLHLFFSCEKSTEVATVNNDLYETKWLLKSLKGTAISIKSWSVPFIQFSKTDKKASGKSPCNTFNGEFVCDYNTNGAAFDMETIGTTKIYCGEDGQLETDFYNMLRDADFAKVVGKQLFMYKNNVEVAVFNAEECQEKTRSEVACTAQYDPVCGCNNKTYGNACEAEAHGITNFKKGECPK